MFAWSVLDFISVEQYVATLHHWAIYLNSGTGHMVITLDIDARELGDIAMTIVVDNQGHVLARSNTMLDTERVVGEQALGALF